jgi:hypothetical protein
MQNIIQRFLLSCHRASKLIEKNQLGRLSYKEEVQLKIHKMMCEACRNYEKQSIFIGKILEKQYRLKEEKHYPEIDLKASIKEKLKHS